MTVPPEPSPVVGSPEHWLRHARSDLRAGIVLRGDGIVLGEKACFHFQQAAEKALKGVLVARSVDFPRRHDIRHLLDILATHGITVPPSVQQAEVLTPYAVQTRYPADFPDLTAEELDEAQAAAEATVAWAQAELSLT